MGSGTRITKEGLKYFDWDGNVQEYVEEKVESYLTKLRSNCVIDMGVTLGDIFNAVDSHQDLKTFIGMYSWCNVDAFHKEAKRPALKKSDLLHLEIYGSFDCGEGPYESFHGIGNGEEYEGQQGSYAIEFTPVNELVDLEVRLRTACRIDKDYKEIETTERWFSLLEVLDAIYFEISFCGSPQQRDEKAADLQQTMKEIEDGTAKVMPWKDFEDRSKVQ